MFINAEKVWFTESIWRPELHVLFEFPALKEIKPLESSKSFVNIGEVKQTRMFSVMAEEAVGYVDSSKNQEEFSGLRHCRA